MRKVPEAATPFYSSPFYTSLLSLNPKLRVKGTAGVGDHRPRLPHVCTPSKSPVLGTCMLDCPWLIDRAPEAPRIPMLGKQEAGSEFESRLTNTERPYLKETNNNNENKN